MSGKDQENIINTLIENDPPRFKQNFQDAKEYNAIQDGKHNRQMREDLQKKLISLLKLEIIFLFTLIFLQGLGHIPFTEIVFKLNEWAFGFFINGCIIQTFFLIRPICANLFPLPRQKQSALSAQEFVSLDNA